MPRYFWSEASIRKLYRNASAMPALQQLLALLGKNSTLLNASNQSQSLEIPGDVPTDVRWTLDSMETFWGEISDSARELMTHCAVESRALLDDGSYVCCVCWEPSMYDSRDKANTICVDYQHRRNNTGTSMGTLVDLFDWNAQLVGARLANISRTLSDPKYTGLPYPIQRAINRHNSDGKSHEERTTALNLVSDSWMDFVFTQYLITRGYLPHPDDLPGGLNGPPF